MKKMTLIAVSPVLLLSSLVLTGCGGEEQDEGAVSQESTQFNGVVIDGALARATVFLDSNNNATRDPWETYAFTDNDGYYSYNPKTETDYCASSTAASKRIYCLKSSRSYSDVIVRIDGGYDLLTGEPFLGQMSRRVEVNSNTGSTNNVISPLTSLLTNIDNEEERKQVLDSLRITKSDLDVNYLDTNGSGDIDAKLLNASLKVHKTVTVLADRLNDHYSELNSESGVMNDPSSEVYQQLAQVLSENTIKGLDFVLSDDQSLTRILDHSETTLRGLFEDKELALPEDMGSIEEPRNFARVIEVSTSIPNIVDQLIAPSAISRAGAVGGARALESFVIKSINEGEQSDTSIDSAVRFFTDSDNTDLLTVLTGALSGDLADVTSLSSNDFSGDDFDSAEEILSASALPDTAKAFTNVAGMQFRVSDLELGSSNALKDIEIEFYFEGSSDSIDGEFTACAKYIDDATANELGEGNTRGELVTGYWSMLGATSDSKESYSLLLTIEFLGATYQAIMKTVGTTMVNNSEYNQVRFDNSGEYRIWHSSEGLIEADQAPTTNADCEARLPSRVGL